MITGFLPTTRQELIKLGWETPDVILISGDTYIDSYYFGTALIGKLLVSAGYSVGIIAQPTLTNDKDITRLGEPKLFWGVTSGCVDSMVSNYTATVKRRKKDDLTPGGLNTLRPDRAVIAYTNLIRRYFKNTKPIVLGGIEASLRRISHYDYWDNKIRRSVLFDAKADYLVYGMGEKAVLELAEKLRGNIEGNKKIIDVRGICCIGKEKVTDYIELPPHEIVSRDKKKFIEMFTIFNENTDPFTAKGLCQKQDTRYLIQNPPQFPLSTKELDRVYELPFMRDVHPYYKKFGQVRALETIKFSITTHRGCYGGCNFCAISLNQGRRVSERSESSIIREAKILTKRPDFKGYINDVGGPTANMYGIECGRKKTQGACHEKQCLFPSPCKHLPISHKRQITLLRKLAALPKVKKVFIASGIRFDLVLQDKATGQEYLKQVLQYHTSGQIKVAPEHSEEKILHLMGKPGRVLQFKKMFQKINATLNKKQYLTYYFIAAHPGCTYEDMMKLRGFVKNELRLFPEQVQIFTPTPSTWSTLMYYTEINPFTGKDLFVEKNNKAKEKQKNLVTSS